MKHLNIKIHGKVQGVFYRVSAREKAEELGINGFVRNEPDGAVYIEAEAREDVLNNFIEWVKEGPEMAYVDSIDTTEGDIKGFSNFSIQ